MNILPESLTERAKDALETFKVRPAVIDRALDGDTGLEVIVSKIIVAEEQAKTMATETMGRLAAEIETRPFIASEWSNPTPQTADQPTEAFATQVTSSEPQIIDQSAEVAEHMRRIEAIHAQPNVQTDSTAVTPVAPRRVEVALTDEQQARAAEARRLLSQAGLN